MIYPMKIKANILLITLFLLLMSSLSSLLVTAYIRSLIGLSASFHDYYKAYYSSSAWLELALVKTNGQVRGYGFEDQVVQQDAVITANFSTGNEIGVTIVSQAMTLWADNTTINPVSCESGTTGWHILGPWDCVPIVLLQDPAIPSGLEKIDPEDLRPVQNGSSLATISVDATAWFTALLTKVDNDLNFEYGWSREFGPWKISNVLTQTADGDQSQLWANGKYILMIANTTSSTGAYCVSSPTTLPTQYVTISAQWRYRNTLLDLKWVRKAWLPADFCYTTISPN